MRLQGTDGQGDSYIPPKTLFAGGIISHPCLGGGETLDLISHPCLGGREALDLISHPCLGGGETLDLIIITLIKNYNFQ